MLTSLRSIIGTVALTLVMIACGGTEDDLSIDESSLSPAQNDRYVRVIYTRFLLRQPDAHYVGWVHHLNRGGSKYDVARGIVRSAEGQRAVRRVQAFPDPIETCYQLYLGRPSDAAGKNFWRGFNSQHGLSEVITNFLISNEFVNAAISGQALSNDGLDALRQGVILGIFNDANFQVANGGGFR